ncbi:hypothetical protein TIFTF001_051333 [Ficus carica]|uniref:Uncharacterized protein n=1 Tax=Ficus carica TaxID=3494 RepID=A0AA88CJQ1_FICCA|nr:hypothetical protein TIFTF001_051333 [Ficus carica]
MAHLTSLLFPLALILSILLVVVASAEYDAPYNTQNQYQQHDQLLDDHNPDNHQHYGNAAGQLGSTPNLGADHLLGNLIGGKQNRNGHEEQQGQENFVPTYKSAYENNKAYYDQGLYPNIDFIGILGFVLCESEANKYFPLEGAMVEIQCPSSYENGYNKAQYSNILRCETDEKGYFREILPIAEITNKNIDLKECKAYPKYSSLETCNVPAYTISGGVNLSLLCTEEHKAYYTVGNLIYTPSTRYSVPNNGPAAYNHPAPNGY